MRNPNTAEKIGLPFGGIGNSGTGVHHGKYGFTEFSNKKGIFRRGKVGEDLVAALYPPYATAIAVADHAFKEAGL